MLRTPTVRRPVAPFPDRLGVLRVMAVRIEPEATAEARFPPELVCGRAPDELDEPAVDFIQLPAYLGERKTSFLRCHPIIEGIDAAVRDVPRRPAPLDHQRQILQRLLLPGGH